MRLAIARPDIEALCGAGYDEKIPDRTNSHNGYRDCSWETRAGWVDLKIPKLRSANYFPAFLEPRRTAENALAAVIQAPYARALLHTRLTIWSTPLA